MKIKKLDDEGLKKQIKKDIFLAWFCAFLAAIPLGFILFKNSIRFAFAFLFLVILSITFKQQEMFDKIRLEIRDQGGKQR